MKQLFSAIETGITGSLPLGGATEMKCTLQLRPSLPAGSFQATVQQGDPDSSSASESLGHGDRVSCSVAAVCGENSRKDGVEGLGREQEESLKTCRRTPCLFTQHRRGEIHEAGERTTGSAESDDPWNSNKAGNNSLFYSQTACRAPHTQGQD